MATEMVGDPMPRDGPQPSPKLAARAEAAEVVDAGGHRAQHLLHHVAGILGLDPRPPAPTIDQRAVQFDQLRPRHRVSGLDLRQQTVEVEPAESADPRSEKSVRSLIMTCPPKKVHNAPRNAKIVPSTMAPHKESSRKGKGTKRLVGTMAGHNPPLPKGGEAFTSSRLSERWGPVSPPPG